MSSAHHDAPLIQSSPFPQTKPVSVSNTIHLPRPHQTARYFPSVTLPRPFLATEHSARHLSRHQSDTAQHPAVLTDALQIVSSLFCDSTENVFAAVSVFNILAPELFFFTHFFCVNCVIFGDARLDSPGRTKLGTQLLNKR